MYYEQVIGAAVAQLQVVPTVLRNGRIYGPAGADTTAMIIDGSTIAWLGNEDAVDTQIGPASRVLDLAGALVTPAFVDAHVHVTDLGLRRTALDLAGVVSAADLLERVAAHAAGSTSSWVRGSGWDSSTWADERAPRAEELSRAAGGRSVYLARVDGHSALVAPPDRGGPAGLLSGPAHDAARTVALHELSAAERRTAQVAALAQAASLGIGCVHEMGGPAISSPADLTELLALADGPDAPGVEVVGYWAELGAIETARSLGAAGAAGDLFCDGSLGSHTAALHAGYADRPGPAPTPYLDPDQIAEHVLACTAAGLQAGFHAIGDAALDTVLTGFEQATARVGSSVRTAGHRIEHVEMLADAQRFAAVGLLASVQPAFDATWGGPDGMYERRLGTGRARAMNDFAALLGAGAGLAFGSDAPVTPLDPWGGVRAAAYHHNPGASTSVRAAFAAHTRGGWRAARRDGDGSGLLIVGAPATYAVWAGGELVIDVPDERVARWSTDPRAAVAGLPDISPGQPLPRCLATVVRGKRAYAASDGPLTELPG